MSKKTVKGLKWINNGIINKRVTSDQLDFYIESGWSLGQIPTTSGYVFVHKDGKNTSIKKELLNTYLANGYQKGRVSKSTIKHCRVYKDNITKTINIDELTTYLQDGWQKGAGYTKDFRWINNLQIERWTNDPLTEGWFLGRLIKNPYKMVKVYNNNGVLTSI